MQAVDILRNDADDIHCEKEKGEGKSVCFSKEYKLQVEVQLVTLA